MRTGKSATRRTASGWATASGTAAPRRNLRPWPERPPSFRAWRGTGEGRDVHAHPALPRGGRSRPAVLAGRRSDGTEQPVPSLDGVARGRRHREFGLARTMSASRSTDRCSVAAKRRSHRLPRRDRWRCQERGIGFTRPWPARNDTMNESRPAKCARRWTHRLGASSRREAASARPAKRSANRSSAVSMRR